MIAFDRCHVFIFVIPCVIQCHFPSAISFLQYLMLLYNLFVAENIMDDYFAYGLVTRLAISRQLLLSIAQILKQC